MLVSQINNCSTSWGPLFPPLTSPLAATYCCRCPRLSGIPADYLSALLCDFSFFGQTLPHNLHYTFTLSHHKFQFLTSVVAHISLHSDDATWQIYQGGCQKVADSQTSTPYNKIVAVGWLRPGPILKQLTKWTNEQITNTKAFTFDEVLFSELC